jgi:uncharacterized membrane protein YukC
MVTYQKSIIAASLVITPSLFFSFLFGVRKNNILKANNKFLKNENKKLKEKIEKIKKEIQI